VRQVPYTRSKLAGAPQLAKVSDTFPQLATISQNDSVSDTRSTLASAPHHAKVSDTFPQLATVSQDDSVSDTAGRDA